MLRFWENQEIQDDGSKIAAILNRDVVPVVDFKGKIFGRTVYLPSLIGFAFIFIIAKLWEKPAFGRIKGTFILLT